MKTRNIFCGYCKYSSNCQKRFFECDLHNLYLQIAKDQHEIDVEKSCEFIMKNLINYFSDSSLKSKVITMYKEFMKF